MDKFAPRQLASHSKGNPAKISNVKAKKGGTGLDSEALDKQCDGMLCLIKLGSRAKEFAVANARIHALPRYQPRWAKDTGLRFASSRKT